MRAMLAIIFAFVVLVNGWLLIAGLLYGIGYLLLLEREGIALMYWLNLAFISFLSPCFGGFLATYITPKIFKKVNANTIATGFIGMTIILTFLISLVYLVLVLQEKPNVPDFGKFALFIVQVFSIVIGAKIGKWIHASITS